MRTALLLSILAGACSVDYGGIPCSAATDCPAEVPVCDAGVCIGCDAGGTCCTRPADCGRIGELQCATAIAAGGAITEDQGTSIGICVPCGASAKPCCAGSRCHLGSFCNTSSGLCN